MWWWWYTCFRYPRVHFGVVGHEFPQKIRGNPTKSLTGGCFLLSYSMKTTKDQCETCDNTDKGIKLSMAFKTARCRACRFREYTRANKAEHRVAKLEGVFVAWGDTYATGDYTKSDNVLVDEYNKLHARLARRGGGMRTPRVVFHHVYNKPYDAHDIYYKAATLAYRCTSARVRPKGKVMIFWRVSHKRTAIDGSTHGKQRGRHSGCVVMKIPADMKGNRISDTAHNLAILIGTLAHEFSHIQDEQSKRRRVRKPTADLHGTQQSVTLTTKNTAA